jgi:hypothetical protein
VTHRKDTVKQNNLMRVKKGDKLAKVIEGAGFKTASIVVVTGVKNHGRNILLNDEDDVASGVSSFNSVTGQAVANYIPGFRSYLMQIEDAKADPSIEFEEE